MREMRNDWARSQHKIERERKSKSSDWENLLAKIKVLEKEIIQLKANDAVVKIV